MQHGCGYLRWNNRSGCDIAGGSCLQPISQSGWLPHEHRHKNFIKRKYDLLIGNLSAEKIKTTIGNACPNPKEKKTLRVKGRDLTSGIPKVIPIGPKDIREAISEEIGAILQTVRSALEELPPELAADVLDKGILLTGGGALLDNLDQLLSEEIGLAITVPENPSSTVVLGAAMVLEDLDRFNRFVLN